MLAYLQGRLHCSQAGVLLGGLPVQQPHDTLLVTVVLALLLQKTSHALSSMPHAQLCYKDFVQHLYNMCPQQAKQLNSTPYNSRQTASRGHAQAGIMVGTACRQFPSTTATSAVTLARGCWSTSTNCPCTSHGYHQPKYICK